MKNSLMAIAATAVLATALPATAQESMQIPYRDLNLSSVEGQQVLDRRIDQAARKLCRYDEVRTGTRTRSKEVKSCYRKAKAQAKKQFASVIEARQLGG